MYNTHRKFYCINVHVLSLCMSICTESLAMGRGDERKPATTVPRPVLWPEGPPTAARAACEPSAAPVRGRPQHEGVGHHNIGSGACGTCSAARGDFG